jgi:hypothetical protein
MAALAKSSKPKTASKGSGTVPVQAPARYQASSDVRAPSDDQASADYESTCVISRSDGGLVAQFTMRDWVASWFPGYTEERLDMPMPTGGYAIQASSETESPEATGEEQAGEDDQWVRAADSPGT